MDKQEHKLALSQLDVPDTPASIPKWKTMPEAFQHYADTCPDKEVVIFLTADGGREAVTFKDAFKKSKLVAYSLIALGVKPGETVAINLRTCPEWLYIAFGAMMAGAIPLGTSFTYKDGSDVVALMKKLHTCSCLVMDPGVDGENWSILSNLVESYDLDGNVTSEQMPYLRYLIGHDPEMNMAGVKSLTELLVETTPKLELPELQSDDLAWFFQTSGSTGTPKIIAHTHRSFLRVTGFEVNHVYDTPITFNDRPFTWIGGYPFSPIIGNTRVTCSGFGPDPTDMAKFICDAIRQEKCQLVFIPATLLQEIEENEFLGADWPVESILVGGNPVERHMLTSIGTFCKQVVVGYGATEFIAACSVIVFDVTEFEDYKAGRVIPGMSVKLVDADGNIVPPNTRGEIYLKSKSLFREYYNDPVKTAAVFTDDGWFKTDDIGRLTEDGSLFVEGRKSNMIISGRMNVAPEILEAAIRKCPGVEAVFVVPVLDDVMYQVICACVKVVPGSGVGEEDVRKFCEEAHGDKRRVFTVLPKYYLLLEDFPKTTSGKVARKPLAAIAENMFNEK